MALVIACGESSPSHIALLRCLNRTLDSIKHNIARIFVNILCCQADSDANARGKDVLPTTFEDFMKNWNENYHLSAQHWFSKKNNSDGEQDPHAVFNALDAMLKDSLERLKTMRESISMTEIGFISCTSKVNYMDHVGIIRVLCMDGFDRWEKDPFFPAAEEVQESADRMESTHRTWIHARKDASSMWDPEELGRDLRTTLGTTKWQLEEFVRAVRSSYARRSCEDARDRHHQFIVAIEDQVSKIEKSLKEAALSEGKATQPWVRLDEGECNELAFFLSGPSASEEKVIAKGNDRDVENPRMTDGDTAPGSSKNSCGSTELGSQKTWEEKPHGHRRTASASADIGAFKIAVFDDGYVPSSSAMMVEHPVRKIPSMSGFLSSMETASKLKWSKNGFRKWKAVDCHEDADAALLPSTQLTRGINACFEKNKSCLDSCDECYDKPLYGWYGAIQRQLQRSQYYMQYSWPARVALWIVILLFLIVLIALRAI